MAREYEVKVSETKQFKINNGSVFYKQFGFMSNSWKDLGTKNSEGHFTGINGKKYSGKNEADILVQMFNEIVWVAVKNPSDLSDGFF